MWYNILWVISNENNCLSQRVTLVGTPWQCRTVIVWIKQTQLHCICIKFYPQLTSWCYFYYLKIHRLVKKKFTITHIVDDSVNREAEIVDGIDADQILTDWIGRHSKQLACKNRVSWILILSVGLFHYFLIYIETQSFSA